MTRGNECKADLIVLGSRSHNLASRLFLGSVASDIVRTVLPGVERKQGGLI